MPGTTYSVQVFQICLSGQSEVGKFCMEAHSRLSGKAGLLQIDYNQLYSYTYYISVKSIRLAVENPIEKEYDRYETTVICLTQHYIKSTMTEY